MSSSESDTNGDDVKNKKLNLFDFTEDQLLHDHELTHYEVLSLDTYATADDVKKAYRKASLKYHPDKTGRGDDDYVFLAVKAAYDVLMDPDKRQGYDSTVVPFDDAIPPKRETLLADSTVSYKDDDFYNLFGPVFQRNLRFDTRLRPDLVNAKANNIITKNGGNNKRNNSLKHVKQPPTLGDASTPLPQVHAFYEYWIHFESWRDFSAQAADELQLENELDNAESRFEKRWIQKEVDKRAKLLKKQEMSRLQQLVERSMDADPRLRAERLEEVQRKQEVKLQRLAELEEKKLALQQEELERQRLEQVEKQERAKEKVEREKEKKQLRKARQQLKRAVSASFEEISDNNNSPTPPPSSSCLWNDLYDMNQDLDLLCGSLSLVQLEELYQHFQEQLRNEKSNSSSSSSSSHHEAALILIQTRVQQVRLEQEKEEELQRQQFEQSASVEAAAAALSKLQQLRPWTREELSALAKAVKKYPAGSGASRWDQITHFVNHLCNNNNHLTNGESTQQQQQQRSKEECLEKYNQIARNSSTSIKSINTSTPAAAVAANNAADNTTTATATTTNNQVNPATTSTTTTTTTDWSAAQDQQLQDGLALYPASMDKNERWTKIAQGVSGKSKKDCVQRFKAIREALLKTSKK